MKKVIIALIACLTLFVSSCDSSAQVIYDKSSFTYEYYDWRDNRPIVYINSVPYYRIWHENHFTTMLVPNDCHCYIRRYDRPRVYSYYVHHQHHPQRRMPYVYERRNRTVSSHYNTTRRPNSHDTHRPQSNRGRR